ncbi:MAG: hypothetical protein KME31_35800 [Tolypothrix carrinoi HA7290-LM1]|nr:hypothetical protein [Tolypothrix carrinoi HA7290-LM1]
MKSNARNFWIWLWRRRGAVKQRGLGGFPHERLLNPKGLSSDIAYI